MPMLIILLATVSMGCVTTPAPPPPPTAPAVEATVSARAMGRGEHPPDTGKGANPSAFACPNTHAIAPASRNMPLS